MNLAGVVFRSLREAGVDLAFGCSDADAFLWEAAESAGLRTVVLLTADGAVDAACAYRRATGTVAAVLGSEAVLGALQDSFRSRSALCAVVGAGRRSPRDDTSLRVAVRLDDAGKAPGLVRDAVAAAVGGRDGPVLLTVVGEPGGAAVEPASTAGTSGEAAPTERPEVPAAAIEEASLLLSLAARPVIWAGGGAVTGQASEELAEVAGLLGAPIVTSVSGKGAVSESHPLSVGPLFDVPEVARVLGTADAAIAVGTTFSARSTGSWRLPMPMQLFHIDLDTSDVGRRYPARLPISGDARTVLGALAARLRTRAVASARDDSSLTVAAVRDAAAQRLRPAAAVAGPALDALRRAVPDDVPTVWDLSPARWALQLFPVGVPGTFHAPAAASGPGFSLSAALGVAASGRGPVIAIMGAGELLYRSHDLAAIATAALPVIAVAFDGPVWAGSPRSTAEGPPPSRLRLPDVAALASAFDIHVIEAGGIGDLGGAIATALARALANGDPTLVAVH